MLFLQPRCAQESDQQSSPPNITCTLKNLNCRDSLKRSWPYVSGCSIAARLRDSTPKRGWREGYYRYRISLQKGQTAFFSWMVWPVVAHLQTRSRAPVIMSLRRHSAVFVLLLCFLSLNTLIVSAFSKSELLFRYGEAVSDRRLDNKTDDFNSIEVQLTTPVVFYDQIYNSIYVSWRSSQLFWTEIVPRGGRRS